MKESDEIDDNHNGGGDLVEKMMIPSLVMVRSHRWPREMEMLGIGERERV